jgi:hypothetical protein
VLITCQRLGVDPYDYLNEVFQTDTSTASAQQIDELTPQAFANKKLADNSD